MATLVLLVVLEFALAMLGVVPEAAVEDPLAGFAEQFPHLVEDQNADGVVEVRFATDKLKHFNQQTFLKTKPAGTLRVVCLGGSTTYGRPFFDETSFCGWLRAFLPLADPSHGWEVINAGGISYASYRVAAVAREMARYDPDIFVLLTGHNEFLERRTFENLIEAPGWKKAATAFVLRTRTGSVLWRWSERLRSQVVGRSEMIERLTDEVRAIPVDLVGPEAYRRDPVWRDRVLKEFRRALGGMADLAERIGAYMCLVLPASNLRDFSPFRSEHRKGFDDEDAYRWDMTVQRARRLRSEGRPIAARLMYLEALQIDDSFAGLQFEFGQLLLSMGRAREAKDHFVRAREEDICPLRAISAITDILKEVAGEHGIATVDFAAILEPEARYGILGEEWFYDHVHPREEANRLLALAIVKKLGAAGIVQIEPSWDEKAEDVTELKYENIDKTAHAAELQKLALLLERLGEKDQALKRATEAMALTAETRNSLEFVGSMALRQQQAGQAVTTLRRLVSTDPDSADAHGMLGMALVLAGELEGAAIEFQQSISISPDNFTAHQQLGLLRARQGRFVDAVVHLSKVTRLEPDSAAGFNNLGLALAKAGQTSDAIENYRRALALDPGFVSAHYNYGLALEDLGDVDGAIERYTSVLDANPDHVGARRRLQTLRRDARADKTLP